MASRLRLLHRKKPVSCPTTFSHLSGFSLNPTPSCSPFHSFPPLASSLLCRAVSSDNASFGGGVRPPFPSVRLGRAFATFLCLSSHSSLLSTSNLFRDYDSPPLRLRLVSASLSSLIYADDCDQPPPLLWSFVVTELFSSLLALTPIKPFSPLQTHSLSPRQLLMLLLVRREVQTRFCP